MPPKKRFIVLNANLTPLTKERALKEAKKMALRSSTAFGYAAGFYVMEMKTLVRAMKPKPAPPAKLIVTKV